MYTMGERGMWKEAWLGLTGRLCSVNLTYDRLRTHTGFLSARLLTLKPSPLPLIQAGSQIVHE